MALSFRTPTGLSSAASSTQTFAESAGNPQPGDVRYLFLSGADNFTLTGPTGWTSVANFSPGTGNGGRLGVFRKNYVVGEGAATFTFSTATYSVYHVVSVAGANTGATPQLSTNSGTTTTLTATTLTPSTANSLQLAFFGLYNSQSGATLSTPTGMSPLDFRQSPGALGVTGSLVYRMLTATTATGDAVSTANVTPQTWLAANVVIAPAAGTVKSGQFLPFFEGF